MASETPGETGPCSGGLVLGRVAPSQLKSQADHHPQGENTMTVGHLIALLSEMDPGDEVRLATQPEYPLAFDIAGVAALDDEDELGVVWIAAGDHPDHPYAPRDAFDQAQY